MAIASRDLLPHPKLQETASENIFRSKKFPKSARILTGSHFKLIHRNSTRYLGELIAIHIRQGRPSLPKLGITVSKKFGKSHDRNRFKRVVREAFRELLSTLPPDLEINVAP